MEQEVGISLSLQYLYFGLPKGYTLKINPLKIWDSLQEYLRYCSYLLLAVGENMCCFRFHTMII